MSMLINDEMPKMLEFFDTHCHIDEPRFDEDRSAVLLRMAENNVTACVCVGSDMETSRRSMAFAKSTPSVYAAVGIHPHEAQYYRPEDCDTLAAWFGEEKVVAIGEIGLDYYYDHSPREAQKIAFEAQLDLACRIGAPAILHVRDAHGDTLDILRSRKSSLPTGIIHCYSGSLESAREYVTLGFYIALGGAVTFKKAPNLWEVAKGLPLDRLLIETDSPYLSPEPFRGRRNEPAYVVHVAERIAALRGEDVEHIAAATTENARRVYRVSEEA